MVSPTTQEQRQLELAVVQITNLTKLMEEPAFQLLDNIDLSNPVGNQAEQLHSLAQLLRDLLVKNEGVGNGNFRTQNPIDL